LRTEIARRALLAAALCFAGIGVAGSCVAGIGAAPARAQESAAPPARDGAEETGHGVRVEPAPLLELESVEAERRYQRLLGKLICKCPSENWTRTLATCRDACAEEQKLLIRERLRQGWSDERIIAEQVERWSSLVLANPGWTATGMWLFLLPAAALVAGAWIAGRAIRRSQEAGAAARRARRARQVEIPPEELARIERDLEKIE